MSTVTLRFGFTTVARSAMLRVSAKRETREIIFDALVQSTRELLAREIEADENYVGDHPKGERGRGAAGMFDSIGDGDVLLANRGYDSDALRLEIAERGAWANIHAMPQRKIQTIFSHFLYKYRNVVECFFNKIEHFRAVATPNDK